MRKMTIIIALFLSLFAGPCFARLNVVATLPWIGSIAGELGKDKINVIIPEDALFLKVSDIAGKLILEENIESFQGATIVLDLTGKPKGVYIFRIILKGMIISEKMILQ